MTNENKLIHTFTWGPVLSSLKHHSSPSCTSFLFLLYMYCFAGIWFSRSQQMLFFRKTTFHISFFSVLFILNLYFEDLQCNILVYIYEYIPMHVCLRVYLCAKFAHNKNCICAITCVCVQSKWYSCLPSYVVYTTHTYIHSLRRDPVLMLEIVLCTRVAATLFIRIFTKYI